jgi:carboxypeptidase C (cathepsin A)
MNYRFVQKLDWSHGDVFREVEMRNWSVDGNVAGKTKNAGKLTFATIAGAGHMASLHDCSRDFRVYLTLQTFRFLMINLWKV